jgi:hypothetical protein
LTDRPTVHQLPASPIGRMPQQGASRNRWLVRLVVAAVVVALVSGVTAVYTNAFGVGDRFDNLVDRVALIVDPPPDRPTRRTVAVTAPPSLTPAPTRSPSPAPARTPRTTTRPVEATAPPTPSPTPSPSPTPARVPVDVHLSLDPKRVFQSQLTKDWCAPAGVQMTLAALGLADNSEKTQDRLAGRVGEWESRSDSLNGGWGPAAIAEALAAHGAEYEIRAYETRADALRDSARVLSETGSPVVIIAWRGAHTWVMTGYRADADPTVFPDAAVSGAYVYDPWYPRVSSIWGPSDPPGTFQDAAEMERNFLPWQRPEGKYPDRDGRFLVLVPLEPIGAGG